MSALPPLSEWQQRSMSEADWSTLVHDTGKRFGWLMVHYRPVKVGKRWSTALEGDPGCPDWIIARDGVVLLVELKRERRWKYEPGQREWLAAAGARGRLWRPSDWPAVWAELSAPRVRTGPVSGSCGTVSNTGDQRSRSRRLPVTERT